MVDTMTLDRFTIVTPIKMCKLIVRSKEVRGIGVTKSTKIVCEELIGSTLHSAKTTLGTNENAKRVFIQDLAAALNRRSYLENSDVEAFKKAGYNYMKKENA